MGAPLNALLARPYNNLGIPGANVADLVDLTHGNPNGHTAERFSALVLRNVPGSPFDGLNAVTEANLLRAGPRSRSGPASTTSSAPRPGGCRDPGVTIDAAAPSSRPNYSAVLANIAARGRTIVAGNVPGR